MYFAKRVASQVDAAVAIDSAKVAKMGRNCRHDCCLIDDVSLLMEMVVSFTDNKQQQDAKVQDGNKMGFVKREDTVQHTLSRNLCCVTLCVVPISP